jgi:hypothetical protein
LLNNEYRFPAIALTSILGKAHSQYRLEVFSGQD